MRPRNMRDSLAPATMLFFYHMTKFCPQMFVVRNGLDSLEWRSTRSNDQDVLTTRLGRRKEQGANRSFNQSFVDFS